MRPEDLELRLYNLLHDLMWASDNGKTIGSLINYVNGVALVETFEGADLLTIDRGLVITTDAAEEFYVTITQRL